METDYLNHDLKTKHDINPPINNCSVLRAGTQRQEFSSLLPFLLQEELQHRNSHINVGRKAASDELAFCLVHCICLSLSLYHDSVSTQEPLLLEVPYSLLREVRLHRLRAVYNYVSRKKLQIIV